MVAVGGILSSPVSLRDTLKYDSVVEIKWQRFYKRLREGWWKARAGVCAAVYAFLTGLGTTLFCENVFIFIFIYVGLCGSAVNEK